MSEHSPEPSLENYPGWFPPAKRRFWTRLKVGTVALLVGLVVGAAMSGGDSTSSTPQAEPAPAAASASPEDLEATIDAAVDRAVSDADSTWEDKLGTLRSDQRDRLAQVRSNARTHQEQAVRKAVSAARADERAKAASTITQLRAKVAAASSSGSSSSPAGSTSSSGGGTDPRFSYCYEANAAGYGPYFQGSDPEYDWYDDADGDGEVCE